MAAALGTWTSASQTKPKRIEGHTSNVEQPILYVQYFKGTIGETTEADDTYVIPHKFTSVKFITIMPLTADVATQVAYGNGTTVGVWFADSATVLGPTQITTAATAGASTVVLTSATDIADAFNGCWLEIRYASGNKQVVQITDFAATTLLATLAEPLTESIATTGTYYIVRGTLMTVNTAAATPALAFEIVGTFE